MQDGDTAAVTARPARQGCRAPQKGLASDPASLRKRHMLKAATKPDIRLTGTSAERWFLLIPILPTPNIVDMITQRKSTWPSPGC